MAVVFVDVGMSLDGFIAGPSGRAGNPLPGGTTFIFVTDGFGSALEQARRAAGGRDVRLSGGARLIQQGLQAGVVDELTIHVAPVLLGAGVPLFDRATAMRTRVQQVPATPGSEVTHLTYQIAEPGR
ncbi:MAG TPA: dihydrofolate reductase family protein [Gemmatimonadales bacterium]|nr:dihydrofolate reductase family protein [Gemmatimonadales bacterium]